MIFAAYLVLSVAFLWPLSAQPADTVAYVGDSLATVYFIAENGRRLWSDPFALFSAGIAHPHADAALFEAHRLLPALLAGPMVALSGNPILAVNLLGWLAYAFNAWSARRLALFFGISPVASFGLGALFAFNTYAVLEQPRLNIIFLGFIPLAIMEAIQFARSGDSKAAWRATGLWLAQAYTENYSAIYGGILILLASCGALLIQREAGALPGRLRTAALPILLAAIAFLPVAIAYSRMDAIYDFRREPPYSMDLSHFFATQPGNWLYGKIGPPARAQQQGAHFVGFAALLLAGVALFSGSRGARRERAAVLAASILTLALVFLAAGRTITAFGQPLLPGPYGFLYDHVPLFTRTRIPERFGLLAMLPLALLAGRGVDLLTRNHRILRAALAILLSLEHLQRFPWTERLPTGSSIPAVYGWLRENDARAVVEAPTHGEGLVRMESVDMYFQLFHHKPVLAAYVSFPPLLTRILRQVAVDLPHPDALRTLSLAGVDTIVYHQETPLPPAEWIDAETTGAIFRRASFPRAAYWLRPSGSDVVFGIPRDEPPAETTRPAAGLRRMLSPGWRYRATTGRPALAADGDADTQWIVEDTIAGGESFEIGFGSEAVAVAAIAIPLTRRDILPTRFLLETRNREGAWSPFASFGPAEQRALVRDLMRSPGQVVLTLDGEDRVVTGVRLIASPGARSFDGWRVGEIEVLVGPGRIE